MATFNFTSFGAENLFLGGNDDARVNNVSTFNTSDSISGAAGDDNVLFINCPSPLTMVTGPNAYAGIGSFMSSFLGRLILFGYTWALMHHMLGGIRHLIWDTGHGFGPQEREWLAVATLVGSISLTVVIWIVGYLFMGGPR